ncbi:hypothetical protein TCAL_07637 [Tigriopus californicus]|uniref:F-box domain-containing protein n=2 Tax=Tigriopus californicus TaxID=6832 RepID=A0A553NVX0_TIGCA|nr:uncharacterized protein LOC131880415 isoform X2 [Tigriopus californicus]TRY69569.1 hypothetical protein TCAL_07637 [Tigriopus californicus]
MRPHTRTQCQDGTRCEECQKPGPSSNPVSLSTTPSSSCSSSPNSSVCDDEQPKKLDPPEALNLEKLEGFPHPLLPETIAPNGFMLDQSGTFLVPSPIQRPKARSVTSSLSTVSELGGNSRNAPKRNILLVELPAEVLIQILRYLPYSEISHYRTVSRRFNELCSSILNTTFQKFQSQMLKRFHSIKSKMPRRESARRNHPLARESDIIETLHMRLTLLQMTFGKHIERKHVCFFAGEILDEVTRIVSYIHNTPNLGRAYKVTDELFDLSTMAMEYFKEKLEPTLPDITYFAADFLDDIAPYKTPVKKQSQNGNSNGLFMDSPCSSRASVADSAVSEPWFGSSMADDIAPTSNVVLRKSIRSIRKGMKRQNTDLNEVKRELKSCKTKIETQTKQIQEYSQRLEDYDKKFEESANKFQTLLTELNKCKTELQFWRSKASQGSIHLASNEPIPNGGEVEPNGDHPMEPFKPPDYNGGDEDSSGPHGESPNSPRVVTRGSYSSGPPSPSSSTCGSTRKRRLRHDDENEGNEPPRKSLRGTSTFGASASASSTTPASNSCTTRSGAKRPKVSL